MENWINSCTSEDDEVDEIEEDPELQTDVFHMKRLLIRGDEEEEEEDEDDEEEEPSIIDISYNRPQFGLHMPVSSGPSGHYGYGNETEGTNSSFVNDDFQMEDDASTTSDMPQSLETCLALNQVYQDILREVIKGFESVLENNKQQQKQLQEEMTCAAENPRVPIKPVVGRLAVFLHPYFKDINGVPAPENEDTKIKREYMEQNAYLTRLKAWTEDDVKKLNKAVRQNALKLLMQPIINRKEHYVEKLERRSEFTDAEIKAAEEMVKQANRDLEEVRNYKEDQLLWNRNMNLDWMRISTIDMEMQRSPEECELFWKNYLHPSINKEPWTVMEEQRLKTLVETWQGHNWDRIAEQLRTNRSALMCMMKFKQDVVNESQKGPWTEGEDALLTEVVHSCKVKDYIPWHQVAYYFEGRSKRSLILRWKRLMQVKHTRKPWTIEEDVTLALGVMRFQEDWKKIAYCFIDRNNGQCRERYLNSLRSNLRYDPFTLEEDEKLIQLVQEFNGAHWTKIAEHFPGRTDNQLLQRYRRLKTAQEKQNCAVLTKLKSCGRRTRQERHKLINKLVNMKLNAKRSELQQKLKRDVSEEEVLDAILYDMKGILITAAENEMNRVNKKKSVGSFTRRKRLMRELREVNTSILNYFKSIMQFQPYQNRKGSWLAGRDLMMYLAMEQKVFQMFKLDNVSAASLKHSSSVKVDPLTRHCSMQALERHVFGPLSNSGNDAGDPPVDRPIPILPPTLLSINGFRLLMLNRVNLQERLQDSDCSDLMAMLDSNEESIMCMDYDHAFVELAFGNAAATTTNEEHKDASDGAAGTSSGLAGGDVAQIAQESASTDGTVTDAELFGDHVDEAVGRCKRCDLLNGVYMDFKLLRERFLSVFLWPTILSIVPPPEQEKLSLTKKKRIYRKRNAKKPWLREVAMRNAAMKKAEKQLRMQFQENNKHLIEEESTNDAGAEGGGDATAEDNSNDAGQAEGENGPPAKRPRGRPKGYRPPPKIVKPRKIPNRRGKLGPRPKGLQPTRRSTRVAIKREAEAAEMEMRMEQDDDNDESSMIVEELKKHTDMAHILVPIPAKK